MDTVHERFQQLDKKLKAARTLRSVEGYTSRVAAMYDAIYDEYEQLQPDAYDAIEVYSRTGNPP